MKLLKNQKIANVLCWVTYITLTILCWHVFYLESQKLPEEDRYGRALGLIMFIFYIIILAWSIHSSIFDKIYSTCNWISRVGVYILWYMGPVLLFAVVFLGYFYNKILIETLPLALFLFVSFFIFFIIVSQKSSYFKVEKVK